jgi:hypothetical protein
MVIGVLAPVVRGGDDHCHNPDNGRSGLRAKDCVRIVLLKNSSMGMSLSLEIGSSIGLRICGFVLREARDAGVAKAGTERGRD